MRSKSQRKDHFDIPALVKYKLDQSNCPNVDGGSSRHPLENHSARSQLLSEGVRASLAGDGARALTLYEAAYAQFCASNNLPEAAHALFIAAREARANCEPSASRDFVTRLLELASHPSSTLLFKGYLALGHHLINAGKDGDVIALIHGIEPCFAAAAISDVCELLELYACAHAMQGHTSEANSYFEALLDISCRNDRFETQVSRLTTAAVNSSTQGLVEHATLLHERSIKLAKEYDLGFRVPFSMLSHAWTQLCFGNLGEAHALLAMAEGWPSNHFFVRYYRSAVGTLLGALTLNEELGERCVDFGALELAFKSEAPQRIGPIAAALHAQLIGRGRSARAAELLSRSLQAIDNPDDCWWLLLGAAQAGTKENVARGLLILAGYRDDFALARAHRLLLLARSAQLDGRTYACIDLASKAADVFDKLGWRCHRAVALELAERYGEARHLCKEIGIQVQSNRTKASLERKSVRLSVQQREIARLVIGGLTNRQIAMRLGMAERTVKYHLKGAFDKLGCSDRKGLTQAYSAMLR